MITIPQSYIDYCNLNDRWDAALAKAEDCTSTKDFIKHCHTLIHMVTECLNKNYTDEAELIYIDLCQLLKETTCNFT